MNVAQSLPTFFPLLRQTCPRGVRLLFRCLKDAQWILSVRHGLVLVTTSQHRRHLSVLAAVCWRLTYAEVQRLNSSTGAKAVKQGEAGVTKQSYDCLGFISRAGLERWASPSTHCGSAGTRLNKFLIDLLCCVNLPLISSRHEMGSPDSVPSPRWVALWR